MNASDDKRFSAAMAGLAEIFNEALSTPRINAYREALKDLSIEQVEEAARRLMNSAKFFPKPVEFREALVGSVNDQSESAWRTFVKLCVEEGHYPSLYVSDGAMAYAIEHLGGWITAQAKLNQATNEMARAYENQFKTSYRLGQQRGESGRYFAGEYERQNREQAGRMNRAQCQTFKLPVCQVAAHEYRRLDMPFDLATGALTEGARKALTVGAVDVYLPAPAREWPALPPVPEEKIEMPLEVKEAIDAVLSNRRMPKAEPEGSSDIFESCAFAAGEGGEQ